MYRAGAVVCTSAFAANANVLMSKTNVLFNFGFPMIRFQEASLRKVGGPGVNPLY